MDTFTYVAFGGFFVWNICLALRIYRIERFLFEEVICDKCRMDATSGASSPDTSSL